MKLFVKKFKESIKELLKLINEFHKTTGYKVKVQTSIVCLHNSNKKSENKIKKLLNSQ